MSRRMVAAVLTAEEAARRLPHRSSHIAQTIIISGRRGRGKTTFFRHYLARYEPRVLVFDFFGDFGWREETVGDVPSIAIPVSPSLDDALDDLWDGGPCRRRVRPPMTGSREWGQWALGQCQLSLRNCLIAMDEITLLNGPRVLTDSPLEFLILQGRRVGLRLMAASQKLGLIPDLCLSEGTEFVTFNTLRPRDREVLEEWTDSDCGGIVRNLRRGEVLLYCPD